MNYFDSPHDVNGFTASARVYRDLMEIDLDKATRLRGTRFATRKFSLCNERALSFSALRATGTAVFHTELADFEPGAYMQTIQVRTPKHSPSPPLFFFFFFFFIQQSPLASLLLFLSI